MKLSRSTPRLGSIAVWTKQAQSVAGLTLGKLKVPTEVLTVGCFRTTRRRRAARKFLKRIGSSVGLVLWRAASITIVRR